MTRLSEDARWDQFVDPRIETREGSLEGLANERRDLLRAFSQDKFEKMMKGERRAFPEEKKEDGADRLRKIYQAPDREVAEKDVRNINEKWGETYPRTAETWKEEFDRMRTFITYPYDIRGMIYTPPGEWDERARSFARDCSRRIRFLQYRQQRSSSI